MPKRKQAVIVAPQVTLGRQSTEYREMITIDDKKLKIDIKSDSYDFQSHARIYVWKGDTDGWTLVHSIHFGQMKTPAELVYHPNKGGLSLHHYKLDRDELVRVAIAVLF